MKLSSFQLITLCLFAALILVGVGVFASYSSVSKSNTVGTVVIWGTFDENVFRSYLDDVRSSDKTLANVTYVQKEAKTYQSDLINAMASGSGPDLILLSQDALTSFSDKIGTIPYSAISQQTFTDSFIDEAQLYLTTEGTLALPLTVDPLVMYWNKDILSSAGYAKPPQYWNNFLEVAPKLTQLDANSNIRKSAVALGGWDNVQYAKNILATLFIQAGDPIVVRNEQSVPTPVLGNTESTNPNNTESPAISALQFYTEFANPSKTTYSWNRSLPASQDAFVAGDLALYIGLASDNSIIQSRNPNLHYGVALLPQIEGLTTKITFGVMNAFVIPRTSKNASGALLTAEKLTSKSSIETLIAKFNLPSVRRDISVDTSKDAAQSVFAQSALISRAWLDPNPAKTDDIFQDMIESVMSGKAQPSIAVFNANQILQTVMKTNISQ